ncbi:hypothetical protein N7539_002185 [Penicillium diatomitis]|uniref:SCP domain-containing protein n=1 Tax=Penicillium diatomitis TaxID=2819901 RepID=A0A9W9XIC3_9EURO|nr:uncharacterized protein N7539_002185 [Penicillium diatomitis]KAJ5493439.1 hypothetical protein N7539_002185 [Penicillium diatomitis]
MPAVLQRNCTYWTLLQTLLILTYVWSNANAMPEADAVTVYNTVQRTSVVEATPTAPMPASYTSLDDFKDTMLKTTNNYRKIYQADSLSWNDELADYSRKWAKGCLWKHSDGQYGENLAFGYPNTSAAVDAWADEVKLYNFNKPTGFSEKTGHFTQLVWQSTTEVGCAAINCGFDKNKRSIRDDAFNTDDVKMDDHRIRPREADGTTRAQGWYVVCEYKPPGNIVGDNNKYFKENVKPANGSTSPSSSTSASGSQETGGAMAWTATSTRSLLWSTVVAITTVMIGTNLYS